MATTPVTPTNEAAKKFQALVERSRAHLIDLYDSGRWKFYYSEEELLARAREIGALREKWAAATGGGESPEARRAGTAVRSDQNADACSNHQADAAKPPLDVKPEAETTAVMPAVSASEV